MAIKRNYKMKILLILFSFMLQACATCYTGIGLDYDTSSGYIYKVFKPSPALSAGVAPGEIFSFENWPPSRIEGEVFKLVFKNGNTYDIKQGKFCTKEFVAVLKEEW